MNIRDAILKAADHIERNPAEFRFASIAIPGGPGCGTPGCALGWIGAFGGLEAACHGFNRSANEMLELPSEFLSGSLHGPTIEYAFYNRMDALCGSISWRVSASECARSMRLYADKYHPATDKPYDFAALINGRTLVKDTAVSQEVRA
jgi:hypothetical protein